MNFLVAEDEVVVRDLLGRVFRKAGHTVQMCPEGQAAWDAYEPHRFDVVFTDLLMPKLDGLELAERIKARCPEQRIVLLTGSAQDETLPPNIDYVFYKPLHVGALVTFVDSLSVPSGGGR